MPERPSRYLESRLRTAEVILAHYDGSVPFPLHLKAFFRDNRRYGSRDRKEVAALCYQFFRLGRSLPDLSLRERIEAAMCIDTTIGDLSALSAAYPSFHMSEVFPSTPQLSIGLDIPAFLQAHFRQPDLFIRIRPGRKEYLLSALQSSGIPYRELAPSALAFQNATPLDVLGLPDDAYVVQDLSSQRVEAYLPDPVLLPRNPLIRDVCAGSGGKSMLAYDRYPGARLHVSDSRLSILSNLATRFEVAGIREFRKWVADFSVDQDRESRGAYDLVIVDVPCTGSGTWARTPWDLVHFESSELEAFLQLQRSILAHSIPLVRPGGFLLYATCSAFAAENEGMAALLERESGLQQVRAGLLQGSLEHADTMYAALFTSPVG